jgi:hypothetical protein
MEPAMVRLQQLLAVKKKNHSEVDIMSVQRGRYGLGDRRTLQQGIEFSGIDTINTNILGNMCGNLDHVPFKEHPWGPDYIPAYDPVSEEFVDVRDPHSIYYDARLHEADWLRADAQRAGRGGPGGLGGLGIEEGGLGGGVSPAPVTVKMIESAPNHADASEGTHSTAADVDTTVALHTDASADDDHDRATRATNAFLPETASTHMEASGAMSASAGSGSRIHLDGSASILSKLAPAQRGHSLGIYICISVIIVFMCIVGCFSYTPGRYHVESTSYHCEGEAPPPPGDAKWVMVHSPLYGAKIHKRAAKMV